MRLAIPSKGRLREECVGLLTRAGYHMGVFHGSGARAEIGGIEMIEMRPRDAALAIGACQVDAAFLSTDIVNETGLTGLPVVPLGVAACELVLAGRDGESAADLTDSVVATHLPRTAEQYFAARGIKVHILPMGGSLEGVCAAGIADAIIDLRQTGTSLLRNGLRVLDVIERCQALLVRREPKMFTDLVLRVEAVLAARKQRYIMLHLPRERVEELGVAFAGLAAPTVMSLAGRSDLVAVHLVIPADRMWSGLGRLHSMGATGIVATEPEALIS